MVLKSIGVLSAGKVLGILYAAMGVLVGGMMALFSMAGAAMQQAPANGPNPVAVMVGLGAASIIVFPILYGVIGFVGGIICAAIYNVVASVAGGLEIEFENRPEGIQPI